MTLAFFQSSRCSAQPVFLYDIVYGDGPDSYLRYTSHQQPITADTKTYFPAQVDHDKITASGSLDKTSFELRMPANVALVDVFLPRPPTRMVTLVVYRGDANDPDAEFTPIWQGRILGCTLKGIGARFNCEPGVTSGRRPGMMRNWQFGCPHVLYSSGSGQCNANKASTSLTPVVSNIVGQQVVLPDNWWGAFLPADFNGGLAEWTDPEGNNVSRTILRVEGSPVTDTLVLSGDPVGLSGGDTLNVAAGCNHQPSDCGDLHNNMPHYGGQLWIPMRNPTGQYNNFY